MAPGLVLVCVCVGFVLTCLHMFKTQMSRKALIMQQTDNCCHIVGRSALNERQQESGQEGESALALKLSCKYLLDAR